MLETITNADWYHFKFKISNLKWTINTSWQTASNSPHSHASLCKWTSCITEKTEATRDEGQQCTLPFSNHRTSLEGFFFWQGPKCLFPATPFLHILFPLLSGSQVFLYSPTSKLSRKSCPHSPLSALAPFSSKIKNAFTVFQPTSIWLSSHSKKTVHQDHQQLPT